MTTASRRTTNDIPIEPPLKHPRFEQKRLKRQTRRKALGAASEIFLCALIGSAIVVSACAIIQHIN